MDTREDRHKGLSLQECPDSGILLAYTRNQKIENPLKTRLHIDGCLSCRQKCDEYERLNATLDVLALVQRNLSYPEPLAYEVLDGIRRGKRQRSKKAPALSIRVASIPIAFLLTIGMLVVVTAVAALALIHPGNGVPSGNMHAVRGGQSAATAVVLQPRPTPKPHPTMTPASASSPPPTSTSPTSVSTPSIKLCSTPNDLAQSRMRICGYNFTPGNSVTLIIKMPGSAKPKQRPPVVVDAQGNFQDSFIISNCKVPLAIFAQDLNSPVSTNLLQNIAFANCPIPTSPGSTG